ncbi:hypothetical protein [Lysinibacillus piscis]|uniref:Transposase IS204/IS1001/IS1096/IS1165 DDE domain-containing protein n=1 Tax=Lysinibacillus piscis TaxID=2518931 RepID=A0ABQ5NIG8_9BACI|nr:hypothetical protein [Lysinibacillus sp. KH24]GLC88165.1 hypothetical protein LYSBPC_12920 [Lysinibacillus sp. KH24]
MSFFAYYRQQECFEQCASLRTYLVKITVHKSHDYLRSWKNKHHVLFDRWHIGASRQTPEKNVLEQDERNLLTTALFELPITYREVIIIRS